MVNAYPLITDLHEDDTNIAGRFDYKKEQSHARSNIINVLSKYKDQGMNLHPIFMGDIFNHSYKDMFSGISSNNFFVQLRQAVSGMYSMIGNHELSFYKDNPFWTFFSEMKSERVRTIVKKVWQPRGTINILDVVDEIEDGEVRFLFNHFGLPIQRAPKDGKKNIGLFHIDLYAKEIADDMEGNKGLEVFEHNPVYFNKSTVLSGYDYAFFGHMHKMYGKWDYMCEQTHYLTKLSYLASLGRTNHTEVKNSFLERNIPVILVEDGNFVGVEDNYFNLMSREECVNEAAVELSQTIRRQLADKKEFSNYVKVLDDPIENIKIALTGDAGFLNLFEELLGVDTTKVELAVLKELEELRWM